jgi:hypothetical protein
MSEMQIARANIASHIPRETTHQFDLALHDAVTTSIESMAGLHDGVRDCVKSLRAADVGPVQMILAMKACAIDSAGRYQPDNDEYPCTNVDVLIDYIVRWSIQEYYNPVS